MTEKKTRKTTQMLETLACAIALLAAAPAAGFTQPDADAIFEDCGADAILADLSPGEETELGDSGPVVEVARLLVAKDVSDREPVGAGTEFSITDTSHVFAFLEVSNPSSAETTVTVTFFNEAADKLHRSFELEIGPNKRWRTWARTALPKQPGAWSVQVSDELGNVLASTDFAIVE